MPAPTDRIVEIRRTHLDFEALMMRPSYYFQVSEQSQWEIDAELGLLDIPCLTMSLITDEQKERFHERFGVKLS
jgi:hypothetical protein